MASDSRAAPELPSRQIHGVYGYCVVPAGHSPAPDVRGIDGSVVTAHGIAGFAVWLSGIRRPEPTVPNIELHNHVVEAAITDSITPVPLRFGQWAAGITPFDTVITEKADWYRDCLTLVAGALEFGIRVIRADETSPARDVRTGTAASGREYMAQLRDRLAATQEQRSEVARVQAGISEVLGRYVRKEHVESARTPHGIVTLSHLVARADFEPYREQAQRLKQRFPELRFLISGPWPPYSFAA